MAEIFTETMTYPEAVKAFFDAVECATVEERDRIIEEYKRALVKINERELKNNDWLTGYNY